MKDPFAIERAIAQTKIKTEKKQSDEFLDTFSKPLIKALKGDLEPLIKANKGEPGKTPVKGTDYFTDAEIEAIKKDVLAQIPTPENGKDSEVNYDLVFAYVIEQVSKIPRPKDGEPGKDAVVDTAQIIAEVLKQIPKTEKLTVDYTKIQELIDEKVKTIPWNEKRVVGYSSLKQLTDVVLDGVPQDSKGNYILTPGGGGGGAVDSVNGQTGVVVLDANDVGAYTEAEVDTLLGGKASTSHTHTVSQITDFPTLATVATSGDYDDLSNKPDLTVFDEVEQYANLASFPGTGNSAKFYLAQDTGLLYRWTGATYAVISAELALGETSTTAYRGDRGKTAYDHSQLTTGNPHNVTKSDVGLGSVDNVSAASLRDRSTHTGTQTASTISDFNSAALTAAPAETTTTTGALINGATAKATPVDADMVGLMDSAASNVLKKLSWANIKATLLTYFNSIYLPLTGGTVTGDLAVSRAEAAGYVIHTVGNTDSSGRAEVAFLTDEAAFAGFIAMAGSTASGVVRLDMGTSVARPMAWWTNDTIRAQMEATGEVEFYHPVTVPYEVFDDTAWSTSPLAATQQAIRDRFRVAVVRVIHGSTAGTARPDVPFVEWVGSVEPSNATNNDSWIPY